MKTDTDYKQIAYKLQDDIKTSSERDLSFLKDMKSHAIKAFDLRDIVSREMLFKMIYDWIEELEKKV